MNILTVMTGFDYYEILFWLALQKQGIHLEAFITSYMCVIFHCDRYNRNVARD